MNSYSRPTIAIKILMILAITSDALASRTVKSEKKSTVIELLSHIDEEMIKEFREAWIYSNSGNSPVEGLVLIVRLPDGSYQAKLQNRTNQYKKVSFSWSHDIAAIVHTHPKTSDPKPSTPDEKLADSCGVPVFTITACGMYVYDPATRTTSKVMDRLDWLKPSKWNDEAYAKLLEERQ